MVEIPTIPHLLVTEAIRAAMISYRLDHPALFMIVTGGTEVAVRIPDRQTERHPDVAVYLTPPPTLDGRPWDHWVPDIAVEVVSPGSEDRDYYAKRGEYLDAGIREYWIFDPPGRTASLLVRHGETWQETRHHWNGTVGSSLLPEFSLSLGAVFALGRDFGFSRPPSNASISCRTA